MRMVQDRTARRQASGDKPLRGRPGVVVAARRSRPARGSDRRAHETLHGGDNGAAGHLALLAESAPGCGLHVRLQSRRGAFIPCCSADGTKGFCSSIARRRDCSTPGSPTNRSMMPMRSSTPTWSPVSAIRRTPGGRNVGSSGSFAMAPTPARYTTIGMSWICIAPWCAPIACTQRCSPVSCRSSRTGIAARRGADGAYGDGLRTSLAVTALRGLGAPLQGVFGSCHARSPARPADAGRGLAGLVAGVGAPAWPEPRQYAFTSRAYDTANCIEAIGDLLGKRANEAPATTRDRERTMHRRPR